MLNDSHSREAGKQRENAVAGPVAGAGLSLPGKWQGVFTFLTFFLKWGLALLFIVAGVIKLWDPKAFARAIGQYGLVPDGLVPVLAGMGLLLNARGGLGAILAMLLMFIGVLGYAIAADLDIDCGCFTAAELAARGSVKAAFFQDLGFLAAALFLWRRGKRGDGGGR